MKPQRKKTDKKAPPKKKSVAQPEWRPKDFLDMVAPTAVKFNTDHYILGSTYRCAMAVKSYPSKTDDLAILRHLGERSGVTLRIYTRKVTPAEENAILHNASNRSRMERSNTDTLPKASLNIARFSS